MTIKLVGISAGRGILKNEFVQKVMEKYKEELKQIKYEDWQPYIFSFRMKLAELVRKELTVFEKEGSETFIPQTIISEGDHYYLYELIDAEGEKIALYNHRFYKASDIYLSMFLNEAVESAERKKKEQ